MKDSTKVQLRAVGDNHYATRYRVQWRIDPSEICVFLKPFNIWRSFWTYKYGDIVTMKVIEVDLDLFNSYKSVYTTLGDIRKHIAIQERDLKDHEEKKKQKIVY